MEDTEKWLEENFPLASKNQQTILIRLITKAKKLKQVEEELQKNNEYQQFLHQLSEEHEDFYKQQLESEKAKRKIENMVRDALISKN